MGFQTFFASRSRWIQAAAFALALAIPLAVAGGGGALVPAHTDQGMQPAASASLAATPAPKIEAPIGAGWG